MKAFCVLVVLALAVAIEAGSVKGRGFGDDVEWFGLKDGLERAKESNTPAVIVIHKTWCGACKRLGPILANSKKFVELSKDFVMINILDDEEPQEPEYSPDGSYIPRLLFVSPKGQVQTNLINEGGMEQYKYYYPDENSVIRGMEKAKKTLLSKKEL